MALMRRFPTFVSTAGRIHKKSHRLCCHVLYNVLSAYAVVGRCSESSYVALDKHAHTHTHPLTHTDTHTREMHTAFRLICTLSWLCGRPLPKGKRAYSSSWNSPQNYVTPLANGITQCYLPPDRGDRPAVTSTGQVGTRFIDPVRMKAELA